MSDPPLDPSAIFDALDRHGVRYVAIGGTAVNAHGVPRATFDVDVTVPPDPDNYVRLAAALDDLGAPEVVQDITGFIEVDPRDDVDLARARTTRVPTRAGILDVLERPSGAPDFDEMEAAALDLDVRGVRVRVASLDHLVSMKRAAGRPKDLGDLADLLRDA